MTDIKRMDVHEALDKVRAENEKLKEEVRTKTDLYNNLRKAQIEMVTKFQETKLQSEKQAKELNSKSEEMISNLEEKLRDVEDQLKWKNEQFQHLEEAHKKLQDNFSFSKTEWEKEKSLLLDEICSIQRNLDSQTRMSESLQTQLKICNQTLAHEESNRKLLEVEVSEYKSRFDNIFLECHEMKETIENLSHKRDEEVAELRDSLATKDSVYKEMVYKMAHLEQENQDLITSVKELQESQIVKCGPSVSLKKLQKKYQDLEQVHKKCIENLKEKEFEWKSQLENAKKDLNELLSKMEVQDEKVKLENIQIQNHEDGLNDLSQKIIEIEKGKFLLETSLKACKIENQSLLCKESEQNEKIVDLQQKIVLLETMVTETIEAQKQDKEKYFKMIQDKESSKENLLIGFEKEKIIFLHVIEERNKRIEELIEEMTNAFKNSEEKQIENHVIKTALEKMEFEVFDLSEKMKVKDGSLFEVSQHVEELQVKNLEKEIEIDVIKNVLHKIEIENFDLNEKMKLKDESLFQAFKKSEDLEVLLGIKKLENEKIKEQFGDEKRELEVENNGLREDIKKLLLDRDDLISQMETMFKQMGGFCEDDEVLMGMLDNMLKKSTV